VDPKDLAIEAKEIADALIDRYLDVTDLSEEFDLDSIDSESARALAKEVGDLVSQWVVDTIESA
jgi:hypothetical protein